MQGQSIETHEDSEPIYSQHTTHNITAIWFVLCPRPRFNFLLQFFEQFAFRGPALVPLIKSYHPSAKTRTYCDGGPRLRLAHILGCFSRCNVGVFASFCHVVVVYCSCSLVAAVTPTRNPKICPDDAFFLSRHKTPRPWQRPELLASFFLVVRMHVPRSPWYLPQMFGP